MNNLNLAHYSIYFTHYIAALEKQFLVPGSHTHLGRISPSFTYTQSDDAKIGRKKKKNVFPSRYTLYP